MCFMNFAYKIIYINQSLAKISSTVYINLYVKMLQTKDGLSTVFICT